MLSYPIRAVVTTLLVSLSIVANTAQATSKRDHPIVPVHGIAMHGDLKYPYNFTHFEYTNPDAPKGGSVTQASIGTFDTFNPFIIKGTPADGVSMIYDTLTTQSSDEPFSEYGLLAESMIMPPSRRWIEFNIRPEARFSDGKPVTAQDVVFTFDTLRTKGSPFYRAYYADIKEVKALSRLKVRFSFADTENRELPLIVGQVPILPKHYWADHDFERADLSIPLGSGPYLIDSYDQGRSVTYRRNPNYWGQNIPVNKGRYNFDKITFDYYRDSSVALEAFKAGEYDFRRENASKAWATAYTGTPFDEGRIIKQLFPNDNPTGMQAFVMNTRQAIFADRRVREALGYAFDFQWTNKNLFYGAYARTNSFFSNSEMAAKQPITDAERKLLMPFKDQLPPEVFTEVYKAPVTTGDGNIRPQMRKAIQLLNAAGWKLEHGVLRNKAGKPFQFEILLVQKEMERIVMPFIRNLNRMGIEANIRLVDVSQYMNRMRSFDFDMIVGSFPQSSSPGNEQRDYWSSENADRPGSRNLIGIKSPAVDYLVNKIIQAEDRQALVTACRALDRVLQWNFYVIPQFHTTSYRVAYWNKFGFPKIQPRYGLGFDTWWIKN